MKIKILYLVIIAYTKKWGVIMAKPDDTKRLNVVIDTDLHKKLKMAAAELETTIGAFVAEAIKEKLEKTNK